MLAAAAEMADLRESVKELRSSIDALAVNADLAQDKILKTNLRDARASAALRVQQLSTATMSSMVSSQLRSSDNDLQGHVQAKACFCARPCHMLDRAHDRVGSECRNAALHQPVASLSRMLSTNVRKQALMHDASHLILESSTGLKIVLTHWH